MGPCGKGANGGFSRLNHLFREGFSHFPNFLKVLVVRPGDAELTKKTAKSAKVMRMTFSLLFLIA